MSSYERSSHEMHRRDIRPVEPGKRVMIEALARRLASIVDPAGSEWDADRGAGSA